MKVFVTGGSGLVGKNLVEKLKSLDYTIFAPDRDELELFNYESVKSYIQKISPDIIIHCAGKVGGIAANIANPVAFLIENINMGCNIILAARECGIKKFINLGSSCMYPRNHNGSLTENLVLTGELEPTNEGYALAKIVIQRLCSYIKSESFVYNYKTIIPCNIYGKYDNFNNETSHLIPAIINKIHYATTNSINTVEIWGDGSARREFMYVEDLCSFIAFVIENYIRIPDLINVGLGYDYSITEYYQKCAQIIGYDGEFKYDNSKPVGMQKKLVDTTLLKQLGWEPKFDLERGVEETYNFFLNSFRNTGEDR